MFIKFSLILLFSFLFSFAKNPVVEIKTSKGSILVELNEKGTPIGKKFLSYVKDKHYDGTIFHRVINNFMIQGGGFDKEMNEKPTKSPILNEAHNGLSNDKYTIAMARTSDPNSATAQFYINVNDNSSLNYSESLIPGSKEKGINHGYAVFGKVTKGQEVVDSIKTLRTGMKNVKGNIFEDVPTETILIESIKLK